MARMGGGECLAVRRRWTVRARAVPCSSGGYEQAEDDEISTFLSYFVLPTVSGTKGQTVCPSL